MKKSIYATALAAVAALTLAACGEAPDETTEPADDTTVEATEEPDDAATGGEESDFTACLISDQGGWDDQSFNQSAMEGAEQARDELGIQLNNAESQSEADFGPNVDAMVQENCDITIGVGFLLEDPIQGAAEGNADLNFGLVDATFSEGDPPEPVELDNAKPIIFNTAEAAYLAGYVAAGMSETRHRQEPPIAKEAEPGVAPAVVLRQQPDRRCALEPVSFSLHRMKCRDLLRRILLSDGCQSRHAFHELQ